MITKFFGGRFILFFFRMQAKARAKKSNKNIKNVPAPPQTVDISILTEEQKETLPPKKEIDLFMPHPRKEGDGSQKARLSAAYTTVSPKAFTKLKPLPEPEERELQTEFATEYRPVKTLKTEFATPYRPPQRFAPPPLHYTVRSTRLDRDTPPAAPRPAEDTRMAGASSPGDTQSFDIRRPREQRTAQDRRPAQRQGARQEYDMRQTGEIRQAYDIRQAGDVRQTRDLRQAGDVRQMQDLRQAGDARQTRDLRQTGNVRQARDQRQTGDVRQTQQTRPTDPARQAKLTRQTEGAPQTRRTPRTRQDASGYPAQRGAKKPLRETHTHTRQVVHTDLQQTIPVRRGRGNTRPAAIREERKNRRKRTERLTYVIVFFVLVFIVAGIFLLRIYMNYRRSAGEYADLTDSYVVAPAGLDAGEIGNAEDVSYYPALNINFASLFSLNDDFVGWIYVPGSDISYPVVQGEDNDYYLRHTFLDSPSSSGAIFMDAQDSSSFVDFNTFIYGHNMQDGSMFSNLSAYRQDYELVRMYPYFYIYLRSGDVKKYRICSFYNDDGYSDSYLRVTTPEDKQAYLAMIRAKSIASYETGDFTDADSYVTLSTCQDSVTSGRRFLVHGVLVGTYKNEAPAETP